MLVRSAKVGLTVLAISAMGLAQAQGNAQTEQSKQDMQAQSQAGNSSKSMAPDIDVSDQEVQEFAKAQNKVQEIRKDYSSKLSGMDNQEKARKMQAQMQQKMLQAVKDTGMNAKKYNKISQAAMQDKDLRSRIKKAMN